jgi:hypothetical protein
MDCAKTVVEVAGELPTARSVQFRSLRTSVQNAANATTSEEQYLQALGVACQVKDLLPD